MAGHVRQTQRRPHQTTVLSRLQTGPTHIRLRASRQSNEARHRRRRHCEIDQKYRCQGRQNFVKHRQIISHRSPAEPQHIAAHETHLGNSCSSLAVSPTSLISLARREATSVDLRQGESGGLYLHQSARSLRYKHKRRNPRE